MDETPAPTPPPPPPVRPLLLLLRPLLWVLGLLLLLGTTLAAALAWLGRTEDGTRWLLARIPIIQAQGVRGSLFGGTLGAERLRVSWNGGQAWVQLDQLAGEGIRWQLRPDARTWAGVEFTRLAARRVEVHTGPSSGTPARLPNSLALPLRIVSARVEVDELQIDTLAPWRGIRGRAGISDGGWHHAEDVQVDSWDRWQMQGHARIASTRPFAMDGDIQAQALDGSHAGALKAGGQLDRMTLDALLRSRPEPGRSTPSADVHAVMQPYAGWPFAELSARTEALDLAALSSAAPETRLSGQVQVGGGADGAPLTAQAQVDNTLPGRWNERRVPVRQLVLAVQAPRNEHDRLQLDRFDALLAGTARGAGRVSGRGTWKADALDLEATLADVQPQQLDGRAPAFTLAGPVTLALRGLPSPGTAAATAPPPWAATLRGTLDGRVDSAPQPVRLEFDASASASRIEVRRLSASSGSAKAETTALAQPVAGGAWQLQTRGTLGDFDPVAWWPGDPASAWHRGPHRLNAQWQVDLQIPAQAAGLSPLALAPRLAGSGSIGVKDSVLAGVPVALDLTLGQSPTTPGTPGTLRGELVVGGNTLVVDGVGNPMGDGSADRLNLDVDAPALASLAPLLRLSPELAAWAPSAGSLKGRISANGRWPELRTEGRAELTKLEAGHAGVAQGTANWHLDFESGGDRPLQLQAELAGMRWGTQSAELLRADLKGTLQHHTLLVSGALPLAPPALAEQLSGVRAQKGTRALVQAQGEWAPRGGGGGRWSGRIARLAITPWDGNGLAGDGAGAWLDTRELSAEIDLAPGGAVEHVHAAAGAARLADIATLQWDEVDADLRAAQASFALRARIEPFAVAPLLARAQPAMGWRGDLKLAGSVDIRAAERFDADIVFERREGDLQTSDEGGTQALGLSDLRIALAAHDGTWLFSQAFAGRTLGEMAGALSVRSTPQRRWPARDDPMDGVLQLRVANLGVWGAWVPAGWRLGGELRTSATIGGRWGAPEYAGEVSGRDVSARNLLQGVNITQGDVLVKLDGAAARIERFTARGGDGTLALTGGLELTPGDPTLRLKLLADHFRVLGRVDRRLVMSGNGDLMMHPGQLKVDGRLMVDEGRFDISASDAPALDDDVNVRQADAPAAAADSGAAARPRMDVAVAVGVDLGSNLRVKGRGLDTALRGQLMLTTPGGRLAVNGTVIADGGIYKAYGQNLSIERGNIAFGGAVDNPRLDILALRPNIDTRVGVQITGNLLTPRVRLYAETDMSDTDKLSWLVLGRATDGLGRSDTMLLQRAAVALLAGEGEAPTDQLIRALGLDEISLKSSDTDVRETVVSVGKQLSRRWYLGYERGVNATTGTWQLIYRIAQRFTLRAQSGGENALDIIWTWKFDHVPLQLPLPGLRGAPAAPSAASAASAAASSNTPVPARP